MKKMLLPDPAMWSEIPAMWIAKISRLLEVVEWNACMLVGEM